MELAANTRDCKEESTLCRTSQHNDITRQQRVIIWSSPRCLSTAFLRALTATPRVKPVFQIYTNAYYAGEDAVSDLYDTSLPGVTFSSMRDEYEASHEGYDAIIGKETSYSLKGKLNDTTWLPKGYIHTFIIRTPEKSVRSLHKAVLAQEKINGSAGSKDIFKTIQHPVGFKEQLEMFQLVTEQLQQAAIVLDADDLLKAPEPHLKEFCRLSGLQYAPAMLDWNQSSVDLAPLIVPGYQHWFEHALSSTSFKTSSSAHAPLCEVPVHMQELIDENLVYYQQLYKHRIILQ